MPKKGRYWTREKAEQWMKAEGLTKPMREQVFARVPLYSISGFWNSRVSKTGASVLSVQKSFDIQEVAKQVKAAMATPSCDDDD